MEGKGVKLWVIMVLFLSQAVAGACPDGAQPMGVRYYSFALYIESKIALNNIDRMEDAVLGLSSILSGRDVGIFMKLISAIRQPIESIKDGCKPLFAPQSSKSAALGLAHIADNHARCSTEIALLYDRSIQHKEIKPLAAALMEYSGLLGYAPSMIIQQIRRQKAGVCCADPFCYAILSPDRWDDISPLRHFADPQPQK